MSAPEIRNALRGIIATLSRAEKRKGDIDLAKIVVSRYVDNLPTDERLRLPRKEFNRYRQIAENELRDQRQIALSMRPARLV